MKRHPALVELSSDHHQGLVQARRLVKAANGEGEGEGERTQEEVARAFLDFWAEHTRGHFREEEEVLLPAFARYGDPSVEPVVRVLVEHIQIRQLVDDLRRQMESGRAEAETMRAIGDMLREHIRHEENVLFPLIEQAMPEEALVELPARFAAFVVD
jgi:hemerythrin-like domain-containing protein